MQLQRAVVLEPDGQSRFDVAYRKPMTGDENRCSPQVSTQNSEPLASAMADNQDEKYVTTRTTKRKHQRRPEDQVLACMNLRHSSHNAAHPRR